MAKAAKFTSIMSGAERAVRKRSNKMLAATTKRYRRFMKRAAKATNSATRSQYLASALTALVVAGAVAAEMIKSRINKKPKRGRRR